MSLPPDRGHVRTEHRSPRSADFDALSVGEAVALVVDDHRRVAEATAEARDALTALIEDLVPRMQAGGRLVYVGAGTSGRLGVLDASECPPTFQASPDQVIGIIAGGDRSLRRSSEGLEDDEHGAEPALAALGIGRLDSVIGIAAGGTTPYVVGAIRRAAGRGAMTALVTCAAGTASPPACDHLIVLDTGPELLTGSTRLKAASATKLALNTITTIVFTRLGKVYSNLMVDLRATNSKLRDRAIRIMVALCPGLTRPDAGALLERADGRLKVAVLMHHGDLTTDAATARLERYAGRLREALATCDRSPEAEPIETPDTRS